MNITIKKWGNSQGVILPKMVLDSLDLRVDDDIKLEVNDNKIILTKNVDSSFDDFSDLILEDLIKDGYEGERLLREFRRIKSSMPAALDDWKTEIMEEYRAGQMIDYEEFFND